MPAKGSAAVATCGPHTEQVAATRNRRPKKPPGLIRQRPLKNQSSPNQLIILGMGPDPEPIDRISLHQAQCSPAAGNAHRIQRLIAVDALEMQAGMFRIVSPQAITLAGLFLDFIRQAGETDKKVMGKLGFHSSSIPALRTRPARISSRTFSANFAS